MSLLSFINAALNVKSAYSSYQTCYAMLTHKNNWDSKLARMDFESGARMAIGAFDLMISFIPNKFSKLLEFVGFSGDRQFGLHELMMSESLTDGSRWPVSAFILGGYNLFLEVAYGLGEPDLKLVDDIAHKMKVKFPKVNTYHFSCLLCLCLCVIHKAAFCLINAFDCLLPATNRVVFSSLLVQFTNRQLVILTRGWNYSRKATTQQSCPSSSTEIIFSWTWFTCKY